MFYDLEKKRNSIKFLQVTFKPKYYLKIEYLITEIALILRVNIDKALHQTSLIRKQNRCNRTID